MQVHAVLQATISRLALLAVIMVDPHVQAQELTQSVGEEISRMIQHQKELESRFHELIAAQPALHALPNKANLRKNQAELQEVSAALRQATKQLCRCDEHSLKLICMSFISLSSGVYPLHGCATRRSQRQLQWQ
jgi:hypothetical protein